MTFMGTAFQVYFASTFQFRFFSIYHFSLFELISHVAACKKYSVDEIKQKMSNAHVVGVTCLGINHSLLTNKKFDICIMDEAGQTTLPVSV